MENTPMTLPLHGSPRTLSGKILHEQCLPDVRTHSRHLTFTFIFEVSALFLSGVITIVWGSVFLSGSLVLAGFLVSLLGMALYGWTLTAES